MNRQGQNEIINSIVNKNVLAIMPTLESSMLSNILLMKENYCHISKMDDQVH